MKFYNALSDFLYDKSYFITIFENKIHIFRYVNLVKIDSKEMVIELNEFTIKIQGENMCIKQMNNEELIISGDINEVYKIYE